MQAYSLQIIKGVGLGLSQAYAEFHNGGRGEMQPTRFWEKSTTISCI